MFSGGANVAAAGQRHFVDGLCPDRPDAVGCPWHQFPVLGYRPDLGGASNQFTYRYALAIGQADKRVAGHALAQVGHHRPLVGPLFQRAVELRQGDDRDVQFLGQPLERPGDFRDFSGPVFAVAVAGHELEVIDHDQAQLVVVLPGQPAGPGADLHGGQAGRFVDEHRGFVEPAQGAGQLVPVVLGDPPGAQLVLVEPADGAEHPHHQLGGAHFHTEYGDRQG